MRLDIITHHQRIRNQVSVVERTGAALDFT